jgi:hypothetical protein
MLLLLLLGLLSHVLLLLALAICHLLLLAAGDPARDGGRS